MVEQKRTDPKKDFSKDVKIREERKIKARKKEGNVVYFGVGMFGVIGWAVTLPAIVFTFIGVWIDVRYETPYSWTLMLFLIGLIVGCLNAWFWIKREREKIVKERESNDV